MLTWEDGSTASTNGGSIDMFLLHPGMRTARIEQRDHVGNLAVQDCTFPRSFQAGSFLRLRNNLPTVSGRKELLEKLHVPHVT